MHKHCKIELFINVVTDRLSEDSDLCLIKRRLVALTYWQLQFLAKWDATGSGTGAPVGGGAGVRSGALWGVLLRLAAGVTGGTLRLEHLPPEILPAQQSARDLLITEDAEREWSEVGFECLRFILSCKLALLYWSGGGSNRKSFKSFPILGRVMAAGLDIQ